MEIYFNFNVFGIFLIKLLKKNKAYTCVVMFIFQLHIVLMLTLLCVKIHYF